MLGHFATSHGVWLFVWVGFYVPLENFSLIWRRHHYRWRVSNFDLCSALMAIDQWRFFSVPHLLWHGHTLYMIICKDPWHPHLLPSVWQLSYHYLFLRLLSVAAGIRTPSFCMRCERSNLLRSGQHQTEELALHLSQSKACSSWFLLFFFVNSKNVHACIR